MKKLAIVVTHPIQYYAPMFRLLAERGQIELKVFYTWSQAREKVKDKTFGREIKWDIPMLEGYNSEFVKNISTNPGSNRWNGIINPELIPKLEFYKPDAILIFGWKMKSHFRVMKHFKDKVPVWFRGDSTLLDDKKGIKVYFRRILLRYVYKNIDKAFYVGQESKKYFKAHGLREEQLIYAPHAIENERFLDSKERQYEIKAGNWRRKLGYKQNDKVILFAGKFEGKKNPLLLIKAVQGLNRSLKAKINLLMVGNGPLENEMISIINNDKNIKVLPFQNQSKMPLIYRLGNLFCLPSKGPGETWGLAINEAMACGRPVVVSNKVGCVDDLVKNKGVGYVFESENVKDLEHSLKKALSSDLALLGKNSENLIQAWNFERICKAIEESLV